MLENIWVGKNEKMDPETEDLIFGENLQAGMVVLVESQHRTPPMGSTVSVRTDLSESSQALRDEDSRWCRIESFKPRRTFDTKDGVLRRWFIGVYADGTKAVRVSEDYTGWLVKKNSMPAERRAESFDPRPEWYQDLYCDVTGYMRHNVDWSKVELIPWLIETQTPMHFCEQIGITTYKRWDIPMGLVSNTEHNMRNL